MVIDNDTMYWKIKLIILSKRILAKPDSNFSYSFLITCQINIYDSIYKKMGIIYYNKIYIFLRCLLLK